MNVPKGTEIFKDYGAFNSRLNEMLLGNNIAPGYNYDLPVINSDKMVMPDIEGAIERGLAKGNNRPAAMINIDKKGMDIRMATAGSIHELRNNSLRCNGRKIR